MSLFQQQQKSSDFSQIFFKIIPTLFINSRNYFLKLITKYITHFWRSLAIFIPFSAPPRLAEAHSCWKQKAIVEQIWSEIKDEVKKIFPCYSDVIRNIEWTNICEGNYTSSDFFIKTFNGRKLFSERGKTLFCETGNNKYWFEIPAESLRVNGVEADSIEQ